jgi:hypothetical protein
MLLLQEEKQKMEEVKLDKKGRPVRKSCGVVNYSKLLDMDEEKERNNKKKMRNKHDDSDDDNLDSWVEEVAKQQQMRSQWGQCAKT